MVDSSNRWLAAPRFAAPIWVRRSEFSTICASAARKPASSAPTNGRFASETIAATSPTAGLTTGSPAAIASITAIGACSLSDESASRSKRSEEHTSELQSLVRISYAVFCLKKKTKYTTINNNMITHNHHQQEMT